MSPFSVFTMDVKSPSQDLFDSCDYSNLGARSDSGIDTEDQAGEDCESVSSSEGTNKLRAVGLQTLAELCVLCFRPDGSANENSSHFPRTLFLVHKWFVSSETLAQTFFGLYRNAEKTVMCNPRKFFHKLTSSGDLHRPVKADDQKPVYERIFRENLERLQTQKKGPEDEDLLRANQKLQARRKSWQKYSKEVKEETKRRESFSSLGRINSAFEKTVGRYGNGQTSEHDTCYRNGRHCSVCLYRRQVCHALRFWILQFPVHFSLDTKLANLFRDFSEYLTESQQFSLSSLLDLSSLPSYEWVRNVSVRDPSVRHSRKVSLVFNHLEPNELAEHLTFLEHRIMRRISFQEYKQYALSGSLSGTPRLERSVALFNGLTQWVQCMVLGRSTPQQRAESIVKLVAVTKKLLELRNFNSLMAVVGGLSHSSLARLTRTAACVPVEAQRDLAELAELLSSSANFANYRRALHECKGFKIPILGIHLKDLISVNVAMEDFVDVELINFRKMQQLASIFQELQEVQLTPPPDGANMDLVNTLRVSLDLAYSEDEIYELSLSREPRSYSPQCSPTRAHSSEWGSPCHIPNTARPPISKNLSPPSHLNCTPVRQFVKQRSDEYKSVKPLAVSRRCRSSSSSSACGMSHPAVVLSIPSTSVLASTFRSDSSGDPFDDTESRSTESPVEMNHMFYETVCIKPTLCAHCSGLLWGPIKQGFRCRNCGITAHGPCKEVLPNTCKSRKDHSSTHSDSDSGSSMKLRYRRKKKSFDATSSKVCTCEVYCCEPCKARPRMDRIHSISGFDPSHPNRFCFKYQRPLSQYMNLSPKKVNLLPGSPMPARRKSSLVSTSQSQSFPGLGNGSSSDTDTESGFRKKGSFRLFGQTPGTNVCTCDGHTSKL